MSTNQLLRVRRVFLLLWLSLITLLSLLKIGEASQADQNLPRRYSQNQFSVVTKEKYKSLPPDYPYIEINTLTDQAEEQFLFVSTFTVDWASLSFDRSIPYLLILDSEGEPVFHRRMQQPVADFKPHPNGTLTYFELGSNQFTVLDRSYNEIDSWQAIGYPTDNHDIQFLPNGNAILMIYDIRRIDMSELVEGGDPNAQVVGLILQEIDAEKNLVFEWQSWDHLPITDSTVDLTASQVDYIHGNSIEVDQDGNWIISSRYLDEITKINRSSGEVMWRLGGKGNQFTFIPSGPESGEPFFDQHDARMLSNGNLLLFDNRTDILSSYARAVEYSLDHDNLTATRVWEYQAPFPGGSRALGSVQRLDNGNTLIGWGSMYPSVSEVTAEGEIAFEMSFEQLTGLGGIFTVNSYRARKGAWEGDPEGQPSLIERPAGADQIDLYTSWNGATGVARYQVYGGETSDGLNLIQSVRADRFETHIQLDAGTAGCYFMVEALNASGESLGESKQILVTACLPHKLYLPYSLEAEG